MAGSTVLNVVYGIDAVGSDGSSYFDIAEKAVSVAHDVTNVGSYLGMSG
jgi:hypothetical protein